MASLAAMRTAPAVTLGRRSSLEATFTARPVEAMMRGLPDDDGGLTEAAVEPALEAIGRADAVVLGPGLGRTDGARAFARTLFERVEVLLVVDADGLNALAGAEFPERPGRPSSPRTRASWGGCSTSTRPRSVAAGCSTRARRRAFGRDRGAEGRRHAGRRPGAAGSRSHPRASRWRPRAPATCSACWARCSPSQRSFRAACAAVYAHLRAGQLRRRTHGPDGVIASDVIACLPAALNA